MTKNTETRATLRARSAEGAAEALSAGIAKAEAAGARVLSGLFGPDADTAAVRYALKLAMIESGELRKPTSGGTATKINAMIKVLDRLDAAAQVEGRVLAVADFVAAAREVLDAHAAAEAARKDALAAERAQQSADRAAIKSVRDDRGAPKSARLEAMAKLADLDAAAQAERDARKLARLTSAVAAALGEGFSAEQIMSAVQGALAAAARDAAA